MTTSPLQVDGVTLAVVTKRLESIVNKMHNTLLRTARSGVVSNGRDFSCCIVTAANELLACGEAIPIHVMVGADLMTRSMSEFHPRLARGDAYLHNSPYHGCSHPADHTILVPVIDDEGVHRYTVLAKAHQADIGNSIPTTYFADARDVYEEGALIFPAVKTQTDYHDIEDIIRMCMMRIRAPGTWWGDYLAALGAARIGERELLRLGAEAGWKHLDDYARAWFDYSEGRMANAIRRLPSGTGRATCTHDPFPGTPDEGIPITARVSVDPETARIEVDLRDNPDCLPNGLNLSESCTFSAAMIGVFDALCDDSVPPNHGSLRRIKVLVRKNCVVGIPRHPSSCSVATTNVAERLISSVQVAMAGLGENIGMAEVGVSQSGAQAVVSGNDPRKGNAPFVSQITLGDTMGAAVANQDGWLTLLSIVGAGLSLIDSVEVDELLYPIVVKQRRIVPDSEGAGRFRGAPASLVEFAALGCDLRVVFGADGCVNSPQGVRGGLAGRAGVNIINLNSHTTEVRGWVDVKLSPGDKVTGISSTGGGYGCALERDVRRVKRDVEQGWVSRKRAGAVYGVVFDSTGEVDVDATTRRRAKLTQDELDI